MDVQTLIDKAGGVVPLARLVGVARPTVIRWRVVGSIPGNRVGTISEKLKLPLAAVLALVAPPKARNTYVTVESTDSAQAAE